MGIFTEALVEKLELGYYFWPIYLVSAIVYGILNHFVTMHNISTTLNWIPRPPTVPVLGNAMEFFGKSATDHWKICSDWLDKYGGMVQVWIFHRPTVIVSKKEVAQRLLKGTGDTLTRKSEQYSFLSHVLGPSLLTICAMDWMTRRKVLDPYFQERSLSRSIGEISHHARALVSHLKDKADKSETIDIQHYSKLTTLDVTMDSFMGTSPNCLEKPNQSYIEAIRTTCDILVKRSFTPLYNWSFIYFFTVTRFLQLKASIIINNFSKKIIQRRKLTRETMTDNLKEENGEHEAKHLLDFLLEQEKLKTLNEKDVQNEINTFVFAAHESVATGLAFTLYLIGLHPQIQERLVNEIKSEMPGLSSENDASTDQWNKLDLLERCIKESLRLYPPVPYIGRSLKNYIKIEGCKTLPEGANVLINVYKLHRSEEYYANPNQFEPDRFIKEITDEDYTFIPFGGGWRSCIGQKFALLEMKIILAHILNKYSVMSLDKAEDLEISGNVFLRSAKGLRLRITPRN